MQPRRNGRGHHKCAARHQVPAGCLISPTFPPRQIRQDLLITRFLPLLAIILASLVATGCATKPALHVIGVYEGQIPPGVVGGSRWARCNDEQKDTRPSAVRTQPSIDCHQKHAGKHVEKEVTVHVSDDSRPVVLALTAYDRTLWKVSLKSGVKLAKVILAGYHSQRVSGIPPETPIEVYTHDPSPCDQCWQAAKYFYSYQAPPVQLREITNLEVSSFQGRYKGTEFSIFPGIKTME